MAYGIKIKTSHLAHYNFETKEDYITMQNLQYC